MAIASLELDNLNLFDLNDEESAAVNGGVAIGVATALGTTTAIAVQGLLDPNSTSRDILRRQLDSIGSIALNNGLQFVVPIILGASAIVPGALTLASLGKSK